MPYVMFFSVLCNSVFPLSYVSPAVISFISNIGGVDP